MKTLISLTVMVFALAIISCQKEINVAPTDTGVNLTDNTNTGRDIAASASDDVSTDEIDRSAVILFSKNNYNATSQLSNYEFQFSTMGTVTAINSTNKLNGTWKISGQNDDKLTFSFPDAPLNILNHEWQILEQDGSKIRLSSFNNTNNISEFLTIAKL